MKKNMKYVFVTGLLALGVAAVSVYSCEKETITPNTDGSSKSAEVLPTGDICGKMMNKSIVKFHEVDGEKTGKVYGEALIYNDTKNFYVELKSNDKNIYLTEAFMHISKDLKGIPTGKDTEAALKLYKYSITDQQAAITRKFRIPMNELGRVNAISVAVKLKHMNNGGAEETDPSILWISGDKINSETEGFFFNYEKQVCLTVDGEEQPIDQTNR